MTEEELTDLKNDLITLIKDIVTPHTLAIDEITTFMSTGVIPNNWWMVIFKRDISSDQMTEITDLMDSIHVDVAQEDVSPENVLPEIVDAVLTPVTKKHPSTELVLPHGADEVTTKKDLDSPSVKVSPKKKKGNFFPQPKKLSTQPKKVPLSEIQMAKNLFSLFIKQSVTDEKLDLVKLHAIIGENLSDHTVGHNPQKKELTLYDEKNHPITTFDVQKFIVISV